MVNDRRINYYKVQANTFARINFLKFLQANILFYKTNFKNCYFNSILLRKKSFSCLMTANSAVVLGPKGFKNGKRISLNTEHLFYVMLILQARHQSISFFNPLCPPPSLNDAYSTCWNDLHNSKEQHGNNGG